MNTNNFDLSIFDGLKGNNNSLDIYSEKGYRFALQMQKKDSTILLDSETKKLIRKSILQKLKLKVAKNVISTLKLSKDINKKQKVFDEFQFFYKTCFTTNDYTVASFAKSNSSSENLTLYSEMFQAIRDFEKTQNPNVEQKNLNKK